MGVRKAGGVLVMLAGLAAFAWGLFNLIQTGTCASGGPFQIARPCPEGTGTHAAALTLGVLAAIIAGLVAGAWMWLVPLTFMVVGGSSIAAGLIDPPDGMGSFPFVFGGLFFAFGLLPLIGGLVFKSRWRRVAESGPLGRVKTAPFAARGAPARAVTTTPTPAPPPPPTHEPEPLKKLAQLERLAELERSGAITSAEYERLKTEILSQ